MIALSRAFRGISIAWAGALPLATLAASHPHSSSLIYLFTVVVYGTGSVVCHQLPERSFHLWGAQLPVCARCAGIYAGAAVAAAIAAAFGSTTRPYGARVGLAAKLRLKPPSERPARGAPSLRGFFHSPAARGLEIPRGPREHLLHPLRVLPWRFLVVALPTIATLLYEWTSGVTPSNWIRASAGAWLGAAVGTLIVASTTSPAGPLSDVLFWKRASTAPAARASATPERGERGRGPRDSEKRCERVGEQGFAAFARLRRAWPQLASIMCERRPGAPRGSDRDEVN